MFTEAGFKTCILKGQGNARMYANPLARTSGDIDIWLMVLGQAKRQSRAQGERLSVEETRQRIDEFVHSRFPEIKGGRMHIEFPVLDDVIVEVHYIPRYMYAPKRDRRLQAFFREKAEEQFSNQVSLEGTEGTCAVPTPEFNLVQQLSHMMSHVMGEGIGLRQFIDYYYVLQQFRDESLEFRVRLREIGLLKFAQGVMWILNDILGLDEKYWLVAPNEKVGRFLLEEIMLSGNFGQYDRRVKHGASPWEKNLQRLQRDWRLVWYFPSECLWEPLFRWYHFFWRLRHK
jgi:hypothetical protein